ncbi:hypothetical protein Aple_002430 [Acrocarpospora pleiomorpha]|uniref:HTH iclR-type domain-containing protein n=1 Tax=Acrocarpospora pleiomorpha TaxID=90975 RepID=A0A5M3XGZ3_9ACTN|nr:hypothetical protein Aple_002430 [Acrocarpospora pleiomorpha]
MEKAIAILRIVLTAEDPPTPTQLAARVGISRASVYRLLEALERTGALQRSGRRTIAGPLFRDLQVRPPLNSRLITAAIGPMRRLRGAANGESVGLYVPVNSAEFTCVESLAALHPLGYSETLHQPIPIRAGATSMVFLTALRHRHGYEGLDRALRGLLNNPTAATLSAMTGAIEKTIRDRYCISRGQRIPGSTAVSAAVTWGETHEPQAAITLSGPTSRFSPHPHIGAVLEAAQAISQAAR